MKIKLTRQQWIFVGLFLFLCIQVFMYFWNHWGLITVHSKDTPLAKIIRSIEKQGHVTIKTNIDLNKPVFMNVDEVTLNEALETLAGVMDARWQLTYVIGPDQGTVSNAIAAFESGQRGEDWKHVYVPMPGFGGSPAAPADPRKDFWAVKPASESTLQAYLDQAARNVSASFWVPDSYNPPVKSAPKTGSITRALSKLASASNSKYAEVIMLRGSGRQARGEGGDRGDRGEGDMRYAGNFGGRERGGFDSSAIDERLQNEINKMSGEDRLQAQAERDRRKALLDQMKDLTPEQRRQRFQDLMNTPEMQDKMAESQAQQQNHNTPDQRIARGGGYVGRLGAAQAAAGK
jgi:hypothetical protein